MMKGKTSRSSYVRIVRFIFCFVFAGLAFYYGGEKKSQKTECFFPHKSFLDENEKVWDCFFAENYSEAREFFLSSAAIIPQAEVSQMRVMDGLETDVAILRGNPEKVLWHISGTHGPEGFAGSAIQSAALQYIADKNLYDPRSSSYKTMPTIIFIHALNPYGFANNRRVNEDNIDLNRNFLTDDEFKSVIARDPNFAGYVDIDPAINPTSQISNIAIINDLNGLLRTAKVALTFGISKVKRALVSGNYYKPTGLGFGGYQLSQSARNIIDLAKRVESHKVKQLVLVDVHTGLGPSGVDTLAALTSNGDDSDVALATLETVFPTERDPKGKVVGGVKESTQGNSSDPSGAMAGYDLTVGTMDDFCVKWLAPHLGGDRGSGGRGSGAGGGDMICVTQEFGTVDMIRVGQALSNENYAHHFGTEEERALYGERLRDSFYVQTSVWRKRVGKRGLRVVRQALQHLGALLD